MLLHFDFHQSHLQRVWNLEVQHVQICTEIDIAKLTPSLFSDSIVDDVQDQRTSRVNLVQMNTRIIDHHKNWNILLCKEAIKIKDKKPILNTGLKASKELQPFWTDCVNHLSINLCKVLIVV